MSKFCSFFAFGPRSVTTNLVPTEPFVSGPTWFHLSGVGGGFRRPVLLPQLFRASETGQSLRTAPSLARKTTLGPKQLSEVVLFDARRSNGGPRRAPNPLSVWPGWGLS